MSGWISLHRKIRQNPVFYDLQLLRLWLICLMEASHKDHKTIVGKQAVDLKKGQFVTGRFQLGAKYNDGLKPKDRVKEITIWRWLKSLEMSGFLIIKSNTKFSLCTVVKWADYQGNDQVNDQQNDQVNDQVNDQPMITNNKGNKGLNNGSNNKGIDKDTVDANASPKRFIKPTIQQVIEYCQERNNAVDADKWCDHYESNGWKVGKNSMRDWKAAVRTWEKNSSTSISKQGGNYTKETKLDKNKETLMRRFDGVDKNDGARSDVTFVQSILSLPKSD